MNFIKTPVKGTCDMLPADMRLRERVLTMIRESYSRYGFMEIETPVMEHIENLCSKQGGDNEKLIFKIMKRGASLEKALSKQDYDDIADSGLRYDLTVPLARYYANNSEKLPTPFKALQIGNVWRADNPQKGRFRQFTQCDIDVLGDESNLAEIELIAATSDMLLKIFENSPVKGLTVHINDRRILTAVCRQAGFLPEEIGGVLISLDKMDKIGLQGVREDLLKEGFAAEKTDRYLASYEKGSETALDEFCGGLSEEFLAAEVTEHIRTVIDSVRAMADPGVSIVFDPTLVRGMGYYTGTIFEVSLDGYSFSIAGGGRYDEMIGKFSGSRVCACGFSIGFERIITILKDMEQEPVRLPAGSTAILVHKNASSGQKIQVFTEAKRLREQGKTVSVFPMKKNLNAQFKRLEEEGFTQFIKVFEDSDIPSLTAEVR